MTFKIQRTSFVVIICSPLPVHLNYVHIVYHFGGKQLSLWLQMPQLVDRYSKTSHQQLEPNTQEASVIYWPK